VDLLGETAIVFHPKNMDINKRKCSLPVPPVFYLREAYLEVGGFTEDFLGYFEDVDLGFRFQLMG